MCSLFCCGTCCIKGTFLHVIKSLIWCICISFIMTLAFYYACVLDIKGVVHPYFGTLTPDQVEIVETTFSFSRYMARNCVIMCIILVLSFTTRPTLYRPRVIVEITAPTSVVVEAREEQSPLFSCLSPGVSIRKIQSDPDLMNDAYEGEFHPLVPTNSTTTFISDGNLTI